MPVIGRRMNAEGTAKVQHVPAARIQKKPGRHPSSRLVVRVYHGNTRSQIPVHGNHRLVQVQVRVILEGMGAGDDSVHYILAQHVNKVLLTVAYLNGIADHGLIPVLIELDFHVFQQLAEKWIFHIRDHDSNDSRPVPEQVPGQLIWLIVQLLSDCKDFCPGILRNIACPVKGPGNSPHPYTRFFCHIPDTCHLPRRPPSHKTSLRSTNILAGGR